MDVALRRAYTAAFVKGLLDPEGGVPEQHGPAPIRDPMGPKTSQGGGEVRLTSECMPFPNCLLGAL